MYVCMMQAHMHADTRSGTQTSQYTLRDITTTCTQEGLIRPAVFVVYLLGHYSLNISFSSPPAWNIAPARNSPLRHYILLRMRTSWTLTLGDVQICCVTAEMLNFSVYDSSLAHKCCESARSHFSWLLPPRRNTIHRMWIQFSTARIAFGGNAVMVMSARLHPVFG